MLYMRVVGCPPSGRRATMTRLGPSRHLRVRRGALLSRSALEGRSGRWRWLFFLVTVWVSPCPVRRSLCSIFRRPSLLYRRALLRGFFVLSFVAGLYRRGRASWQRTVQHWRVRAQWMYRLRSRRGGTPRLRPARLGRAWAVRRVNRQPSTLLSYRLQRLRIMPCLRPFGP